MIKKDINNRTLGISAILGASFIWGTLPIVLRLVDGSSSIKVFWRVCFAFLAITVWLVFSGRIKLVTQVSKKALAAGLIQGVILGINWALFLGAFEHASVATVELLGYMGPVFVTILSPFFLSDTFDKRILIPLILAFTGMTIILNPQSINVSSAEFIGASMAGASAITYAILTIIGKKLVARLEMDVLLWFEEMGAALVLLPLAVAAYKAGNAPTAIAQYGWLALLGTVHTALAGWLFFVGLKKLPADQAAIFTYMEPASAVILAALFLNEPLTWSSALGGILIIIGGTIVSRIDASKGVDIAPVEAGAAPEKDQGSSL